MSSSSSSSPTNLPLFDLTDFNPYLKTRNGKKPVKDKDVVNVVMPLFSMVGVCSPQPFLNGEDPSLKHLANIEDVLNGLRELFYHTYKLLLAKPDGYREAFKEEFERHEGVTGKNPTDVYAYEYKRFLRRHPMPVQLIDILRCRGFLHHFKNGFVDVAVPWAAEEMKYSQILFTMFDPKQSLNFFDLDKLRVMQFIFSKAAISCYEEAPSCVEMSKIRWKSWFSMIEKWFSKISKKQKLRVCSQNDQQKIINLFNYLGIDYFAQLQVKLQPKAGNNPKPFEGVSFHNFLIQESYRALKKSTATPLFSRYIEEGIINLFYRDECSRKQLLLATTLAAADAGTSVQLVMQKNIPQIQTLGYFLDIKRSLENNPDIPIELFDRNITENEWKILKAAFNNNKNHLSIVTSTARSLHNLSNVNPVTSQLNLSITQSNYFDHNSINDKIHFYKILVALLKIENLYGFALIVQQISQKQSVLSTALLQGVFILMSKCTDVEDYSEIISNFSVLEKISENEYVKKLHNPIPEAFWVELLFIKDEREFKKVVSSFERSFNDEKITEHLNNIIAMSSSIRMNREHIAYYYQIFLEYLKDKLTFSQVETLITICTLSFRGTKALKINGEILRQLNEERKNSPSPGMTRGLNLIPSDLQEKKEIEKSEKKSENKEAEKTTVANNDNNAIPIPQPNTDNNIKEKKVIVYEKNSGGDDSGSFDVNRNGIFASTPDLTSSTSPFTPFPTTKKYYFSYSSSNSSNSTSSSSSDVKGNPPTAQNSNTLSLPSSTTSLGLGQENSTNVPSTPNPSSSFIQREISRSASRRSSLSGTLSSNSSIDTSTRRLSLTESTISRLFSRRNSKQIEQEQNHLRVQQDVISTILDSGLSTSTSSSPIPIPQNSDFKLLPELLGLPSSKTSRPSSRRVSFSAPSPALTTNIAPQQESVSEVSSQIPSSSRRKSISEFFKGLSIGTSKVKEPVVESTSSASGSRRGSVDIHNEQEPPKTALFSTIYEGDDDHQPKGTNSPSISSEHSKIFSQKISISSQARRRMSRSISSLGDISQTHSSPRSQNSPSFDREPPKLKLSDVERKPTVYEPNSYVYKQLNLIGILLDSSRTKHDMFPFLTQVTLIWNEFDLTEKQMATILFDYIPAPLETEKVNKVELQQFKIYLKESLLLLKTQYELIKEFERLINHKLPAKAVYGWLLYAPSAEEVKSLLSELLTETKVIDHIYKIVSGGLLTQIPTIQAKITCSSIKQKLAKLNLLTSTPKVGIPCPDYYDEFPEALKIIREDLGLALAPLAFQPISDFLRFEAAVNPFEHGIVTNHLSLMNKKSNHGVAVYRAWEIPSRPKECPIFTFSLVVNDHATIFRVTLPWTWEQLSKDNGENMKLLHEIAVEFGEDRESEPKMKPPILFRKELYYEMKDFVQVVKRYFHFSLRWLAIQGNKIELQPDLLDLKVPKLNISYGYSSFSDLPNNQKYLMGIYSDTLPPVINQIVIQIMQIIKNNQPVERKFSFTTNSTSSFDNEKKSSSMNNVSEEILDHLMFSFNPEKSNSNGVMTVNEISLTLGKEKETVMYCDLFNDKSFPNKLRWQVLMLITKILHKNQIPPRLMYS